MALDERRYLNYRVYLALGSPVNWIFSGGHRDAALTRYSFLTGRLGG